MREGGIERGREDGKEGMKGMKAEEVWTREDEMQCRVDKSTTCLNRAGYSNAG